MSLMTPEAATTGPDDDNSYNAGLLDGEFEAITGLSSRRIHARAAMADQYDPLYAEGLIDGYLHAIAFNAALAEKEQTR